MADDKQKHLVFSILEFLQASLNNGTIKEDDSEGIEGINCRMDGPFFGTDTKYNVATSRHVHSSLFPFLPQIVAIQCIGEAFGVDINDAAQAQTYSTKPATLVSIFDVFVNAQKKLKVRALPSVTSQWL